MNKLMILAFAMIFCGFIAAPAAADNIGDNASFFYGITIGNGNARNAAHVADQNTDGIIAKQIQPSEFFYGYSAVVFDDAPARHLNLRNCTYTWGRITPQTFFGYADGKIIVDKCACTHC